jgi:hypothetical protein
MMMMMMMMRECQRERQLVALKYDCHLMGSALKMMRKRKRKRRKKGKRKRRKRIVSERRKEKGQRLRDGFDEAIG